MVIVGQAVDIISELSDISYLISSSSSETEGLVYCLLIGKRRSMSFKHKVVGKRKYDILNRILRESSVQIKEC